MFFDQYEIECLREGIAEYNVNNFSESISSFSKVLEINPANRDAYIRRAYAYMSLGNSYSGIEDLHKAVTTPVSNKSSFDQFHPFVLHGKIKRKIKNQKDLEVIENLILKINESLVSYYEEKNVFDNVIAMTKIGNKKEAIEELNLFIKDNPEHIDAYFYRANLKRDLGDDLGANADDLTVKVLQESQK
tara:strand:+ start:1882 stop:2448 length:567 start_codon:yes stop_codon:yes gene_type:complete